MKRHARIFCAATAVAVMVGGGAACGGEADGGPGPDDLATLAIGGTPDDGGGGFVPLGGDAPLIPGSQGGFHVWLKYRITGMAPGLVKVRHSARRASDARLVLTAERRQELGPATTDGYWELPAALPAFMCPSPLGVRVVDETIRFRIEVLSADGAPVAQGEAEATPRCPSGTHADFCARICSG